MSIAESNFAPGPERVADSYGVGSVARRTNQFSRVRTDLSMSDKMPTTSCSCDSERRRAYLDGVSVSRRVFTACKSV